MLPSIEYLGHEHSTLEYQGRFIIKQMCCVMQAAPGNTKQKHRIKTVKNNIKRCAKKYEQLLCYEIFTQTNICISSYFITFVVSSLTPVNINITFKQRSWSGFLPVPIVLSLVPFYRPIPCHCAPDFELSNAIVVCRPFFPSSVLCNHLNCGPLSNEVYSV